MQRKITVKKYQGFDVYYVDESQSFIYANFYDAEKFLDGLTLESIAQTAKDMEGKGLYYIEVNSNRKIRSISKPYDFAGFEGVTNITRFTSSSYPQIPAANGEYV